MKIRNIRSGRQLLGCLFFMLALVGCERKVAEDALTEEDLQVEEDDGYDLEEHEEAGDYSWEESELIAVILSGTSISTSGQGLSIEGSTARITAAGNYSLSGSLSDGQILVDPEADTPASLFRALSAMFSSPIRIYR